MKTLSRVCAAIAVAMLFASCVMPYSTGLTGTMGVYGSTGTTSLVVDALPATVALTGNYNISEGSLSVTVRAPDNSVAFERTYAAAVTGSIDESLTPQVGEWVLEIDASAGNGSYEIRLESTPG